MYMNVVIGANYGDEGKGLFVDYLVGCTPRHDRTAVVRFNGGAQAGHTVQTPQGVRHVFSHFGAGTLLQSDTILTRFFVSNPKILLAEREELMLKGIRNPTVLVSSKSPVTTVFDVCLNRVAERMRGRNRHGSVGAGFGETLEREERGYSYTMGHDTDDELIDRMVEWFKVRCGELNVSVAEAMEMTTMWDFDRMVRDIRDYGNAMRFVSGLIVVPDEFLFSRNQYDHLVFEGAQGLLLDQDTGAFPYVTRSNTGMKNVSTLITEHEVLQHPDSLDVRYVTRSYITRHGDGPLPHEAPTPQSVVDPTNKPNEWQGKLRYAPIDAHCVVGTISTDMWAYAPRYAVPSVCITCCDQIYPTEQIDVFRSAFNTVYKSYGPTRKDISLA